MSEDRSCCNILPLAVVAAALALAIQFLLGGAPQAAAADLAGATPFISSVSSPVLVGSRFAVHGGNFTPGALVNFFVSTAQGSANQGPLTPVIATSTALMVEVPANVTQGQGVVAIQVVNADGGYLPSNVIVELLQGAAGAGVPSLTAINGAGLAASSVYPSFAVANVQTVVPIGGQVLLQGAGFDTANGVAIDVFCACPGGKVGPFVIGAGDPALSPSLIVFQLTSMGPFAPAIGPGSFQISNRGAGGGYALKSAAVSVPIGSAISVISVMQQGMTLTVDGTGFSTSTVINFFNSIGGKSVNLGGIGAGGIPAVPITLISDTQIEFAVPRGAVAGPAYVQALNPPFVPFSSSGDDPGGAFTLLNPLVTPTATRSASPTPTPNPTKPGATATPTPTSKPSPIGVLAEQVLLAGGEGNTGGGPRTLASAEIYDGVSRTFRPTGSMAYSHFGATMTLLENGEVLVMGGYDGFSKRPLASAEFYDVDTGSFFFTGTMNTARMDHTAVLLNSAHVFVAGGCNVDFSAIDIAEVYQPQTELFMPVPSLLDERTGHTATLLNDGRVLVAGGADDFAILSSAEVCDEDDGGLCQPVGPMVLGRQFATATRLDNGTVLIAGGSIAGCSGCSTATAEIYNPATAAFSATGPMSNPRSGHRANLLPDGRVLVSGGLDGGSSTVLDTTEVHNPATGTFTIGPTMSVSRYQHTATIMGDGNVLIAGGFDALFDATNNAELYDSSRGIFLSAGHMTEARAGHVASLLAPP